MSLWGFGSLQRGRLGHPGVAEPGMCREEDEPELSMLAQATRLPLPEGAGRIASMEVGFEHLLLLSGALSFFLPSAGARTHFQRCNRLRRNIWNRLQYGRSVGTWSRRPQGRLRVDEAAPASASRRGGCRLHPCGSRHLRPSHHIWGTLDVGKLC